jgi:putative MFS transporter
MAQVLSVLGLVPALGAAAAFVAVPAALSLILVGWFGRETRDRDLRELEVRGALDEPLTKAPMFERD